MTQTITNAAELKALPVGGFAVTEHGEPLSRIPSGVESPSGKYLLSNWHRFPLTVAWTPDA